MAAKLGKKAAQKAALATINSEGANEKHTHFFIQGKGPTYRVPTHATRGEKYAEGNQRNKNLAIMQRYFEGVDLTVPQVQRHYSVCMDGTQNANCACCTSGPFWVTVTSGSHRGSGVSSGSGVSLMHAPWRSSGTTAHVLHVARIL